MDIDAKEIKSIVVAMMAKELVAKLDTEARNAILAKSFTDALSDYSFKRSVEDAVSKKAGEIAGDMLASEEWAAKVAAAVKEGFDELLKQLPNAVFKAAADGIAGVESDRGYGGTAGKIRGMLKLPSTKGE